MSNHNTDTAGHLGNNGGVRGHSAGDFFPYRVVVQGDFSHLKYWVVSPSGEQVEWFSNALGACVYAAYLFTQL